MVGQANLIKRALSYTLNTLPHTIMLVGPHGCGRHSLISLIANNLRLSIEDITKNLNQDTLDEIFVRPTPKIYIIDADAILAKNKVEREENVILKFLEEPPSTAYAFVITESASNLFRTVATRCLIWEFEPYKRSELEMFTSNENLLRIANTPGQIIEVENSVGQLFENETHLVDAIFEYGNKVINNLHNTTPSNALTICNRISYEKDSIKKGTYPLDIFMKVMLAITRDFGAQNNNEGSINPYLVTQQYSAKLSTPYVERDFLFANYILNLQQVLKEYHTNDNKHSQETC